MPRRALWAAAAMLLAVAPVRATEVPEPACIDVAVIHAVLDAAVQKHGGRIVVLKRAFAEKVAREKIRDNGQPVEGVDLILARRTGSIAELVLFRGGCAFSRVMAPGEMFDRIAGQPA